jgi:hypothetical protein
MIQQFFSNLKFKHIIHFFLIFSFISFIQFFLIIKIVDKGEQVSIRDLLFTQFVNDQNLNKIEGILSQIEYSKLNDTYRKEYLKNLDVGLLNLLKNLENYFDTDEKVEILLNKFSPSFNLENVQCNEVANLYYNVNTIFTTGRGCCSDYARAAIFLLKILDIKARQVNNYRHTSIEYFNEQKNKWIWIDPSYRIFAYKGKKLDNKINQFQIFTSKINDSKFHQFANTKLINFIHLEQIYHHKPQQYGSISYSLMNTNNDLRDKLIDYGIPKSMVNLIYLITGKNKGKLTVLPNGNSYIFYVFAQIFAYLTILFIIIFNIYVSLKIMLKINSRIF